MASVEIYDYSVQVKNAVEKKALEWLEESGLEIQSAAQNGSRRDGGEFAGKWDHIVDKAGKKVTVGHPDENAIWEEFGTGEYAVGLKPGRKGGWYVPEEELSDKAKTKMRRTEIKGKVFYFTRGKTPNHTLQKAFNKTKNPVINRAKQLFGELD